MSHLIIRKERGNTGENVQTVRDYLIRDKQFGINLFEINLFKINLFEIASIELRLFEISVFFPKHFDWKRTPSDRT